MSVKAGAKAASWRDMPVEKRLEHALVKGIDEFAVVVRGSLTRLRRSFVEELGPVLLLVWHHRPRHCCRVQTSRTSSREYQR